jgi:phospholipase B1
MAMGDSITAGFAANDQDLFRLPHENRGVSFSMGAEGLTLASMLTHYNSQLYGASIGDHLAEICYSEWCLPNQYVPAQDKLNAAQTGATAPLLNHQVDYLIDQLATKPFLKDRFKLLTIFIGNNDACIGCLDPRKVLTPERFEFNMRQVLLKLKTNIPRLVVNIMLQFNVSQVYDLTLNDPYCSSLRKGGTVFECTCAFLPGIVGDQTRKRMDVLIQDYNKRIISLYYEFQDFKNDSFALTYDPLLQNVSLKDWNIGELSQIDCFHPSIKAHEKLAIGIWYRFLK